MTLDYYMLFHSCFFSSSNITFGGSVGRSEIGWYDSICHFCLSVEMKEKLKDLCIYHTFNIYNK